MIETLADLQAQAPQRNMVGDVGVADGAEIDGVRRAEPANPSAGMNSPCLRYSSTPVVVVHHQLEPTVLGGDGLQDFEAGCDDFRADTVGGDRGDAVTAVMGRLLAADGAFVVRVGQGTEPWVGPNYPSKAGSTSFLAILARPD